MELRRGWAGFSLVEALIATAVLGIIAIGVLPMFTQAMMNNKQGSDSTVVTTFSKTNVESLDAVDFTQAPAVQVPAGSLSCVTVDWYMQQSASKVGGTNGRWVVTYPTGGAACGPGPAPVQAAPGGPGLGLALWKRTTTITQYNVTDVATSFSNPEDGSTSPDQVHLKKIQVVVQRATPAGGVMAGKAITLQLLRSD
jgi:type II secretory pathway pseudopilin PulG